MKKILGIICCVLLVGILTFMGVFALSPKVRNSLLDSWGISYEKNEDDAPILDGMPDPDDSTDIPVVETIAFSFEYDDYVVELTMTAGSTWQEFIDSENNTVPFSVGPNNLIFADIDNNNGCNVVNETAGGIDVQADDLIISGAVYTLFEDSALAV